MAVMAKTKGKRPASRQAAVRPVANRPKKLCSWSDDSMKAAMDAVKSGRMGLNRAATEFGVPRTTLKDRMAGRVVHGTRPGPKPYLSLQEENELVDFRFLSHLFKDGIWEDKGRYS